MNLQPMYDFVVIGAGLLGSATAKYLGASDARTLLLGPSWSESVNANDVRKFCAHFDEARISRRLGWDDVWGYLDSASVARYREIELASGVSFFHECGSLVLISGNIADRTEQIAQHCKTNNIHIHRWSGSELLSQMPFFGLPELKGGVDVLFERKQSGYINPRRLVAAQLALAEKQDVHLLRAVVRGVRKSDGGGSWHVSANAGHDCFEILAGNIVIATGAATNFLDLLPGGQRFAMHTFAEPNLMLEVGEDDVIALKDMPPVVTVDGEEESHRNVSSYLLPPIQYPNGRWYVRIGPGMQPLVHSLDSEDAFSEWYARQQITNEQLSALSAMCRTLLPNLRPLAMRHACCAVEKTPSGYPYLGRIDGHEGLFAVVGGNGHGARGSDEIGRLAARLSLGLTWDCPNPPAAFAPVTIPGNSEESLRVQGYLKPPFGLC